MHRLVIKPRAVKMSIEAYQWYEKQQTGLGDLFLNELERCYYKIETTPASCAKIEINFRHFVLKTFPYVIIFEILNDDIVVYAVFHTSRNPVKKLKK